MKIYHGTANNNISVFDFGHCKENRDFGKGVYFTTNIDQAKEWSVKHSAAGTVYEYDVDFSDLKARVFSSKLDEDQLYVIYLCRIGLEEIVPDAVDNFDDADIVVGFMLDGQIRNFRFIAEKFNQGDISFEEFRDKLKMYDEGKSQICIKSARALDLVNNSKRRVYTITKTSGKIFIKETVQNEGITN